MTVVIEHTPISVHMAREKGAGEGPLLSTQEKDFLKRFFPRHTMESILFLHTFYPAVWFS